MKQRLIDFEATIAAIRPYLKQYLESHSIDTSKNFVCINPKHDDINASMTCAQNPEAAHCFGCHCTCNIFTAASYLEQKPTNGKGFIEDNVLYLAEKFNVDVKFQDLTQDELYEFKTYNAYKLASELVSNPDFGNYSKVDKEIERRGWDKQKLSSWGIGTVNHREFKERMRAAGYDQDFLASTDLDRANLFNSDNMIFTVYDDHGRPVGFSARNLKYNSNDPENSKKYNNTRVTGLECNIFRKSERLYGFDVAKDAAAPLYIFEGQSDVITARHYGIINCCCSLGTSFTDHHINLLKKHGIFDIVIVFDGDKAGQVATQKILDEKFSLHKEFKVRLMQLPEGMDPDELLRTKQLDGFIQLKRWSAFEWRMTQFMEENSDDVDDDKRRNIAEKMTQIIASERSHIYQEDMIKQVARMTGFDVGTISSEVKRLRSQKEADIQRKKTAVAEALLYDIRSNPDNMEIALVAAQSAINDINKSVILDDNNSVLKMVLAQKEEDERKSSEFAGFFLNPKGLGGIGSRMNDDWRNDALIYISGVEQSGKTSMAAQMAYEIADDNRNNAICIYHSIDDSARRILYKLICNGTEGTKLHLNHVATPNYWLTQPGHEFITKLREKGYKKIINLVKDEKIIIKDATDGGSFDYAESVVKFYRHKYPEKYIVLFIDNFHKLPDLGSIQGQERVKRLSNRLKTSAVANRCTIIATAEYRKVMAGHIPGNEDMADCLTWDTQLTEYRTGRQIMIQDVTPGTEVGTIDPNTYRIVPQKVNKLFDKGHQKCYLVELENGMSVKGTSNHPLLKENGQWTKISNLSTEDYIAVPSFTSVNNEQTSVCNKDIARLLGYMLSDGNYGTNSQKHPSSTPRFTNSETKICQDIKNIITSNFYKLHVNHNIHKKSEEMRFSSGTRKGNITNELKKFLVDIGIWGQIGDKKTIPKFIFSSSNIIKQNFIAGLFLGDGSVGSHKTSVRLFSTSQDITYGTQTLLLQIGIHSTITTTIPECKKHKIGYVLRVSNCDLGKFKRLIPMIGLKYQKLDDIDFDRIRGGTTSADRLSNHLFKELHKFIIKNKIPVRVPNGTKSGYVIAPTKRGQRKQLKYISKLIPHHLRKFASSDIKWIKIKSIKDIGIHKTYDIEVDNTHNFIANNIFCHNSRAMKYDADVIIHLFNELHTIDESQAMLIHKDENGVILPRVRCKFGKNKVSGYEGREFLDLFGYAGQYRAVDLDQAIQDQIERKEFLKSEGNYTY